MVLHDESEARVRSAEGSTDLAEKGGGIPDWDEVILILQAVSTDEPFEDRNSHSNAAWARLIAALVEQQGLGAAKRD